MKFYIVINSCYVKNKKKVKGVYIDRRTVGDPAKLKCMSVEDWYAEGSNHRVEYGMIARDFRREFEIIELDTLQDLLDWQTKNHMSAAIEPRSDYALDGVNLPSFHCDFYMD